MLYHYMCCSVIRFVTQSLDLSLSHYMFCSVILCVARSLDLSLSHYMFCSVITCVAQSLDLLPSHYMFCSVIISITQSIIYMWLSDCICHSVIMCHACFHFLMKSSFWSSLSVSGTTVVFRQQDFVGQKNVVGHAFDSFEIYDKLSMKDVTNLQYQCFLFCIVHLCMSCSLVTWLLFYFCSACLSLFCIFIAKIHCKELMLLFILQHDFKSCECCGVT